MLFPAACHNVQNHLQMLDKQGLVCKFQSPSFILKFYYFFHKISTRKQTNGYYELPLLSKKKKQFFSFFCFYLKHTHTHLYIIIYNKI